MKINFYICVAKNNNNIYNCIKSIIRQNFNKNISVCINIIENNNKNFVDKTKVNQIINNKKIIIRYYLVKKIGIPFARNKCLELARKTLSDFSCFVDDDCELSKNWLKNMLIFYIKNNSEIITGPQISKNKNIYEIVLERTERHNANLKWAATNNVFLKSNILKKNNIKFDTNLINLGGSDQLFFSKLRLAGNKILWNINSPVFENRNQLNTNFIWFINRNIRFGSSTKTIYFKLHNPYKALILINVKFVFEFIKSIIYFLIIPLDVKKNFLKSIQFIVRSTSTFLSIFNFRKDEYKT